MKALGFAAFVVGALLIAYVAIAQTPVTNRAKPITTVGYLVVATCGTLPAPAYVAGSYAIPTINTAGVVCTSN